MAYFVVAAMMLLSLQACTFLDRCTPPSGEEQLLVDYESQTVWGLLPASVVEAPKLDSGSVVRYCKEIGVDPLRPSHETTIRVTYGPTGYWSGTKLLDVYGPVATASGWRLIAKSDGDGGGSCGLRIEEAGVPSCIGDNGILFCKVIDDVTTDFAVSSLSRSDYPNNSASFDLRMFSRRDLSSCPNPS
jgi:hypothetical protein